MAEIYIPTEQYRSAVAAFAAAMGIEPDDIKTTLGEAFNVWPASIKRDRRR
jgi:cytochrome c-type biogenesis protein CcmH/NrfG